MSEKRHAAAVADYDFEYEMLKAEKDQLEMLLREAEKERDVVRAKRTRNAEIARANKLLEEQLAEAEEDAACFIQAEVVRPKRRALGGPVSFRMPEGAPVFRFGRRCTGCGEAMASRGVTQRNSATGENEVVLAGICGACQQKATKT